MIEFTKVFVIQSAYVIRILKTLVWNRKFKIFRKILWKKDSLCTWTKPKICVNVLYRYFLISK